MAEEKKKASESVKTIIKYILAIVFIALGILAISGWWYEVLILIKGCIGPFLILAGIITFAVAKE